MRGNVPRLSEGELVGRRKELREAFRTLRDPQHRYGAVVLTGIDGVGKSALSGRIMRRMAEDGWAVPSHGGRFDLAAVAFAVGMAERGRTMPPSLAPS
jgi:hypothetical protein